MGDIVFVLKKGKPQSWALGQQNIMAEKPNGEGLKYINYFKGQESIFVEDIKNKDIKPNTVPDFIFNPATNKTELSFDDKDKALKAYLLAHPRYGKDFEVTSVSIEAQKEIDAFEKKEKAIQAVNDISENIRAAAVAVLGFDYYSRQGEECRAALKRAAFNNPDLILSVINNPNFESRQLASLAFCNGVIKTSATGTEILWSSGGVILSLATGENAIDKLSLFLSEATPASTTLLQELSRRLSKDTSGFASPSDNNELLVAQAKIEELERKLKEANKANQSETQSTDPIAPVVTTTAPDKPLEELTLEEAQELYKAVLESDVPVRYKNDKEWLIEKIAAKQQNT